MESMRNLLLSLLLLAGCGDTRDTLDGGVPPGMDAGPGVLDGGVVPGTDGARPGEDGGGPGNDGGGGADSGPPVPTVSFCVLGCAVGSDCTTASPAFDADNYRCEGGQCRYTGCVDDAECQATFGATRWICRDPGTGVRSCVEGCASGADCGSGTSAFDVDNYACEGGICRYRGCNTDGECESTFGAAYGCIDAEPPPTPLPIPTAARNCIRRCASVDDCATDSGAFGADNYVCEGGACRYRGCNDDGECMTSLSSSAYVCR